jgi:hypothetical protein
VDAAHVHVVCDGVTNYGLKVNMMDGLAAILTERLRGVLEIEIAIEIEIEKLR